MGFKKSTAKYKSRVLSHNITNGKRCQEIIELGIRKIDNSFARGSAKDRGRLSEEDKFITIEAPYGEEIQFISLFGQSYHGMQAMDFTLESADRTNYTMTHKEGTEFKFNDGKLMSIGDPASGVDIANITYNGNEMSSVSNISGSLNFTYSGGNIAEITDGTRTVTYDYDGSQLTEYLNPDSDKLEYAYEAGGFLCEMKDFEGNTYLYNAYDDKDRVVSQNMETAGGTAAAHISYDDTKIINTVTDFAGAEKKYRYNEYRQVLDIEKVDAGILKNTWSDAFRADSVTDQEENEIQYEMDEFGKITKAIYPDGNEITIAYAGANPSRKTYKDGTTEEFNYTDGNITSYKDRNGNTTTYTYQNGLLTSMEEPLGRSTTYTYSGTGQLTEEQDELGNTIVYTYDYNVPLVKTIFLKMK